MLSTKNGEGKGMMEVTDKAGTIFSINFNKPSLIGF